VKKVKKVRKLFEEIYGISSTQAEFPMYDIFNIKIDS
jgi:hypothetical protein